MKRRVVAIGLDSADLSLLLRYMDAGELPNIRRLRQQGALARLESRMTYLGRTVDYASTEGNWVMFQTGVRPSTSGYWETIAYNPQSYRATNDFVNGGYDFKHFPPFYALGNGYRVATFDIPVSAVVAGVDGMQMVGWGGHFPYVVRGSQPKELLAQTNAEFGKNPILYRDAGVFWRQSYLRWLEQAAREATLQRGRIYRKLLKQSDYDLFVAVFGETHSASHDLWAAGHPDHPVHDACRGAHDPLLSFFRTVDEQVGSIIDCAGPEEYFVLFSVHGMQDNATDLPCLFFLSELMYRFNFPGKKGIAAGDPNSPPPQPVKSGLHWHWFGEVWRRRHIEPRWLQKMVNWLPAWLQGLPSNRDLWYPYFHSWMGPDNAWMPAMWYRPSWPRSRSFALPAFADGHVRINLSGREAHGLVSAGEYEAECDRIAQFLLRVRDARTGKNVVREVLRTRRRPEENDPRLPLGDLVVAWEHDRAFDVIDSPDVGRIGPVPYFRTGGHRAGGFAFFKGPGVQAGSQLPAAEVLDLPPTILSLLGAAVPEYFEGRPIPVAAELEQRA
jgi:predicted AlkP superfamily phosphohydrolase/phosphomutase